MNSYIIGETGASSNNILKNDLIFYMMKLGDMYFCLEVFNYRCYF